VAFELIAESMEPNLPLTNHVYGNTSPRCNSAGELSGSWNKYGFQRIQRNDFVSHMALNMSSQVLLNRPETESNVLCRFHQQSGPDKDM
jgi:hypothetical protein